MSRGNICNSVSWLISATVSPRLEAAVLTHALAPSAISDWKKLVHVVHFLIILFLNWILSDFKQSAFVKQTSLEDIKGPKQPNKQMYFISQHGLHREGYIKGDI